MKFSTSFIKATEKYSTHREYIPAPYFRKEFELTDTDKSEITVIAKGSEIKPEN